MVSDKQVRHLAGEDHQADVGLAALNRASDMNKALLVEDELLIRELAMEHISQTGFDVAVARDGRQALQMLQEDRDFDLLFTDIKMPGGIDGIELAREARRLVPGLRVIYATGYPDLSSPIGSDERLIQKPYSLSSLLDALKSLGFTPDEQG